MSVLVEEKIYQIMAVSGASYEEANEFHSELGGGYSNAEKIVFYLKHGLTFSEIKNLHDNGLFKYDENLLITLMQTWGFKNKWQEVGRLLADH